MYLLQEHYRQFDSKGWRFVFEETPRTEPAAAEAPVAAPAPEKKETPDPLDDKKIEEIKTEVGKTYDTLEAKLGKDALTPKEKKSLKGLRQDSDTKVGELKTEYTTAINVAEAKKEAGMSKVKATLETSINDLIKAHDQGANDNLDENQERIARAALLRLPQLKSFGGKMPSEDTAEFKALSAVVATLTKDQLSDVTETTGTLPLRPGQAETALNGFFKELGLPEGKLEATDKEKAALKELIKKMDTIEDLPQEIINYIALTTAVEKTKESGIKINGTTITKPQEIASLIVDKDIKAKFDALITTPPPPPGDRANALKELADLGGKKFKSTEQLAAMRDMLTDLTESDKNKPKNWGDWIGILLSLYEQFSKAMATKPPDFNGLTGMINDVSKDMKENKNPIEEMSKAGKIYEDILSNRREKPTVDVLLAAYINPRGAEANTLFSDANYVPKDGTKAGTPSQETRYRMAATEPIKNYLKAELGIDDIAAIEKNPKGLRLSYYLKGKQETIQLGRRDVDKNEITIQKVEYVPDKDPAKSGTESISNYAPVKANDFAEGIQKIINGSTKSSETITAETKAAADAVEAKSK